MRGEGSQEFMGAVCFQWAGLPDADRVQAVLKACSILSGPTSASARSSTTKAFEADTRIPSRCG
jgi:hypothetical protein